MSPIYQQASECLMQRTMLGAVHATEERLIAPRYLMQISAHLALSYIKRFEVPMGRNANF